jgi:hypothetical protein
MVGSTIRTVICSRLPAQDRHVPQAAVPLALSALGPRRRWVGPDAMHGHLTAPAAESTI